MNMIAKLGLMALLIFFLCSVSVVVSADTFNPMSPHADDSESNTFVIGNVEEYASNEHQYFWCGGFSSAKTLFEWEYDTSITGTITQVQVRGGLEPAGPEFSTTHILSWFLHSVAVGGEFDVTNVGSPMPAYDGIDTYPSPWPYDDPLDCARLYINGENVGGASEYITWDTGSSNNGINACFRWSGLNVVCDNKTVVFELRMASSQSYGISYGYWILYPAFTSTGLGIVDVDGDGDSDLGCSGTALSDTTRLNGQYDPKYDMTVYVKDACTDTNSHVRWEHWEDWDDAYQTDIIYEFTYQQGLGGSADITFNETVLPNKKTIEQYDHVYFDCLLNSSLNPNVLTVVKDGTEYVNFTSDRKYFTVHWYPEEIGTYTVNVTRGGSVVAQNTIQVIATESPGSYIYIDTVTPVQTGKYISLFANVSAHTSYEAYVELFYDDQSVFKEYLGSNTSMSIDYETEQEGRYDVELRLEKGLGSDNPLVDTAVFYVQDQEKLQKISLNADMDEDVEYDISYENNLGGTHATYLLIQWIDPSDNSTEQQQISYFKEYTGDIAFTPVKIGDHNCKMYYEGEELYYVNFSVSGVSGGSGGSGTNDDQGYIFEDILTIWDSGAYIFGIDEGMFRLIIGGIVVILSMILPLLLTSKKLGFSITLPMLSNTNFTLLAGIIGVVIAFALGLWDLWVVFLVGIAIVALFVKSMDRNFIGSRSG